MVYFHTFLILSSCVHTSFLGFDQADHFSFWLQLTRYQIIFPVLISVSAEKY